MKDEVTDPIALDPTGGRLKLRVFRAVGLRSVDDALPQALVSTQLRAARGGYPVTFVMTILAAAVVIWTADFAQRVILASVPLMLVSMVSLWLWRADRARDWSVADARAVVLSNAALSFATAVAWGGMLAASLTAASPVGELLILCVIPGVMAVGALSVAALPLASLAFLVGSLVFAAVDVYLVDLPLAVFGLLAVFVTLLGRAILAQAKLFVDNFNTGSDLAAASRERVLAVETARAERERAELAEARADQAQRERTIEARRADMVRLGERFERSVIEAVAALGQATGSTRAAIGDLAQLSDERARDVDEVAAIARRTSLATDKLRDAADLLSGSARAVAARTAD